MQENIRMINKLSACKEDANDDIFLLFFWWMMIKLNIYFLWMITKLNM